MKKTELKRTLLQYGSIYAKKLKTQNNTNMYITKK